LLLKNRYSIFQVFKSKYLKEVTMNSYEVKVVIEKKSISKNYIIDILDYNEQNKTKKQEVFNPVETLLKYFGFFKHDCVSCQIGNCIVQGAR